jgi:hypothetical protein
LYAWSLVSYLSHVKTSYKFISSLSETKCIWTNFIHKDDFEGHNTYLDVYDLFENPNKTNNMLSSEILRDD